MESESFFNIYTIAVALIAVASGGAVLVAVFFRRVVATNEVHIVQSRKETVSYGKASNNGNTYYEWPSWLPVVGVIKTVLPVSNFDLKLNAYEAFDKGRLPFIVDIVAFFRISDSNKAAERVASFADLETQLLSIVQGAVRTILASSDIEQIMQGRSTFGEQFTKEVSDQLSNWGVETVKNIELMDIKDGQNSQVIKQIMEKKKSLIEMESRREVAQNRQVAEIAEIEAERETDLKKQEAAQQVGLRTVQATREVELANQDKEQVVKEKQAITMSKEMAILQVEAKAKADIEKQVQVVKAQQDKETQVLIAEGQLEAKKKQSEGIQVEGEAKAAAEKAMQMAPVEAQIALAKEIGKNESYQKYLVTIEQVKATQVVGEKQAEALAEANIKVIVTSGDATSGLNSVRDLVTPKGGLQVGAMLESFANTEVGKKVLEKVGVSTE